MSSSKILSICLVAAISITVFMASQARSEDAQPTAGAAPAPAAAPAMTPEQQKAQMDAWANFAAPGPEHEWIKNNFVGDWDAAVRFMGAGGSGESKGVMHCKMILGGRYLQLDYEGTMTGPDGKTGPFKGMGIGGFDNGKKKYTNFWIDEMSTGTMVTEGTRAGNVMTFDGQCTDPSGQSMKVREVITVVDNDHHKYELFMSDRPDGQLNKMMEINYTRKAQQ
jgi:hypothetical protein